MFLLTGRLTRDERGTLSNVQPVCFLSPCLSVFSRLLWCVDRRTECACYPLSVLFSLFLPFSLSLSPSLSSFLWSPSLLYSLGSLAPPLPSFPMFFLSSCFLLLPPQCLPPFLPLSLSFCVSMFLFPCVCFSSRQYRTIGGKWSLSLSVSCSLSSSVSSCVCVCVCVWLCLSPSLSLFLCVSLSVSFSLSPAVCLCTSRQYIGLMVGNDSLGNGGFPLCVSV